MPLYDYACTRCGRIAEVRHGFDETYDRPCEACGGPLKRVFNAAPVLFRGSGFYVTDSRRASGKSSKPKDTPATDSDATKSETSSVSTDGGSKPSEAKASEAKPADSKPSDSAA